MLQSMRDKIQGWVAGVIAFIIALTFALWGIQNYLHGGKTQTVAKVNGEKITQGELSLAYERAKRLEMIRSGAKFSFDQQAQLKLKQDILQQLIKQRIMTRSIKEIGLGVGKQMLLGTVFNMPIFQSKGHYSPDKLQQMLQGLGYTEQAFFDELEQSILQMQLEKGIVDSAFVLPNEIATIKKIAKQQRDFGYFVVTPNRFAKTVKITSESIKEYYDQHQNEFLLPEKVSIQYIELSSDNLKNKITTTEEQLKQFYQTHIDSFSTPQKWQVTKILLPLSSKADVKASDNTKKKIEEIVLKIKADHKVDLTKIDDKAQVTTTWIMSNDVPPNFTAQLRKLKPGEISTPFRTKEGYNLIKVLAIQPGKIMSYASVANKVKQLFEQQQLNQTFSEACDKLSDLVYTNPDSLEPVAKEFDLKIQVSGLTTKEGSKSGILANPKVIKTAFSDVVLKQRYNSNLIEIGSGKILVLRIKDHIPEKIQPLDQVREVIAEKLLQQAIQQEAANLANELLKAVREGKSEIQLAKQYSLSWHSVSHANFDQTGRDTKIVGAAFGLAKPKPNEVSTTLIETKEGYVVVRLDKVYENPSYKETAALSNMLKILPQIFGRFDYQTLLNNLERQAKIKTLDKISDK